MSRLTWPGRLGPSLGPGLLMFAVSLISAGRPVLSWDEIATAEVAGRTPEQIVRMMPVIDGVFGPYYLLEHFWTSIAGATELELRLPSMVAMAGAVALTAELGRRLFGPPAGAAAGLLLCLVPATSQYAAEARPYAFACFFAVLSLLSLHVAVDRLRVRRWIAYAMAVLFLGLSHVIALTTLAAHAVVMLRHRDRRTVLAWSLAAGLPLLALAPILWLGVRERHAQLSWVPPLRPHSLWDFPGEVVGSMAGGWLLLGLAAPALCRPLRHRGEVVALGAAPIAVVAAVSVLVTPYWVPRYLLIVLAPLALLAAAALFPSPASPAATPATGPTAGPGVGPEPRRWRAATLRMATVLALRMATVLALLACAVYPAERAVRGPNAKSGSDYRAAAAVIRSRQQPGDAIAYAARSRAMRSGLGYYLRHDPQRPSDVLLSRSAADVGNLTAEEFPPTAARLRTTSRLWFLVAGAHEDPLTVRPELRPVVLAEFRPARIWFLPHETLALFVRVGATTPPAPVPPTR